MRQKSVWTWKAGLLSLVMGFCVAMPMHAQAADKPASSQDFYLQDFGSVKRAQFIQWGIMDSDRYQLEIINDSVTDSGLYAEILGQSLLGKNQELQGSRMFFSLAYKGTLLGLMGRASLSSSLSCSSCLLDQKKQQQYGLGIFLHQETRYVFVRAMISGNWLYEPDLLQRVIDQISQKTPKGTNNKAVANDLIKTFKLQSSFNYSGTGVLGAHIYLPYDLRLSPQIFGQFGGIQESGTRSSSFKLGGYVSLAYLNTDLLQVEAQTGVVYIYHLSDNLKASALKAWYQHAKSTKLTDVQSNDLEYSLMLRAQAHPLPNLSFGCFVGYDHYLKSKMRQLAYGANLTLSF